MWLIRYRIITLQGNSNGKRVYFTTNANGIDPNRHVSKVLMRAAIMLHRGIGYRRVAWFLEILFHVNISKSSLQRWVGEVASELPKSDEIVCLMKNNPFMNVILMKFSLVV